MCEKETGLTTPQIPVCMYHVNRKENCEKEMINEYFKVTLSFMHEYK
jgi:hypothetical protein